MKRYIWVSTMLLAVTAPTLAAQNSCARIKADIEERIIDNGVPETGFTLTVVPDDQAYKPGARVVGHCANETKKILYIRTSDDHQW